MPVSTTSVKTCFFGWEKTINHIPLVPPTYISEIKGISSPFLHPHPLSRETILVCVFSNENIFAWLTFLIILLYEPQQIFEVSSFRIGEYPIAILTREFLTASFHSPNLFFIARARANVGHVTGLFDAF